MSADPTIADTTAAGPAATTIDPASLAPALARLHRIGGDALVQKMIATFLDFAPKKLAEVRAALSVGDLAAAGDAAHALKSSAGNVGSDPLYQAALTTERAARDEQRADAEARAEQLYAAYAAVAAALATLAQVGSSGDSENVS